MKNISKYFLLLLVFINSTLFTQVSEQISADLDFRAINATQFGSIKFSLTKVGILFSGDNAQYSYCGSQVKIYKHLYQNRTDLPGCPFKDEPKDITGVKDMNYLVDHRYPPSAIYFKYIATGEAIFRDNIHWLGFGLYQVRIKNPNLTNENEYIFYIDFLDSKLRAPGGTGVDLTIAYDYGKNINKRVILITGDQPPTIITTTNGMAYRVWDELAQIPVNRYGNFYLPLEIPLNGLGSDTLFSPAIVDLNTTINSGKSIVIDPSLYPEPSKLKDLKLTIADNVTLTAQNNSTLIVDDGAEISLGNNSIININPLGNLFIGANSNWSFGTNSQLIVNGNFKITSKIPSGWNMLSVPNILTIYDKHIVWPNAVTAASTFENGGYVAKSTLENGKGYWVKFNQNQAIEYAGPPVLNSSGLSNRFNVVSGWNMIGAISLNLLTSKITTDPPEIISSKFYGYNKGYYIADTIRPGLGYWVKANQDGKIILNVNSTASSSPPQCSDEPSANPPGAPGIPKLVKPDSGATGLTINPIFRWRQSEDVVLYYLQVSTNSCFTNLIFDDPTIVDTLKQVSLSYSTTYYWRVNASNETVPSSWSKTWVFTTKPEPQTDPCDPVASLSALDNFTITDANGNSQSMYIRNGGRAVNLGISDFDMPPVPPKGLFNVRFQSNKFVETVLPNQKIKRMPIVIKDAQYPVNISWDIKNQNSVKYWLTKPGSNNENNLLTGKGNSTVVNSSNDVIFIEAQAAIPRPCEIYKQGEGESEDNYSIIPKEYLLEQNHPNPFNPTTIIKYQLPFNEEVTLKVYDVLGREVESLVNDYKEAGFYEVEFDASKLPSGVYFYKLQTRVNIAIKKMLLLR